MAYLRVGDDGRSLGFFGCGPRCSCKSCRAGNARLGEWYVPEEDDEPEPSPRPAEPGRTAGWSSYPLGAPGRWGLRSYLGEPHAGAGTQKCPRTHFGAGPAVVLDRFEFDRSALRPFHPDIVRRIAGQVVASWNTQQPVRLIRLFGHTDPVGTDDYNLDLGGRRALEVQNALKAAIGPGLTGQIIFIPDTQGAGCPVADNRTRAGRERNRRVEVFLRTVQATPPPPPPPSQPSVRIPTPEEESRRIEQKRREREEREGTPLPPGPRPRKPHTFSQMFWIKVDGILNAVLNDFRIPSRLRGPVRDLMHRAIQSGSEILLDRGLDALGVTGSAKEAIKATYRAVLQQQRNPGP